MEHSSSVMGMQSYSDRAASVASPTRQITPHVAFNHPQISVALLKSHQQQPRLTISPQSSVDMGS